MPPMALSLSTLQQIKKSYNVTKMSVLDTTLLQFQQDKHTLALVDNLTEEIALASSKFKLKLFVFHLTDQSKETLKKRLYLNQNEYYCSSPDPDLKSEIAKIEKNIKIIKQIGNPQRILVDEATLI